jgi:integrase
VPGINRAFQWGNMEMEKIKKRSKRQEGPKLFKRCQNGHCRFMAKMRFKKCPKCGASLEQSAFWIRYQCSRSGKRVAKAVGRDEQQARQWFNDFMISWSRTGKAHADMTLGDFILWYIQRPAIDRSKRDGLKNAKNQIMAIARGLGLDRMISSFTPLDFDTWLENKTCTDRSAAAYLARLRAACDLGVKLGKIDVNPFADWQIKFKTRYRKRYIDEARFKQLWAVLPEYIKDIAMVAYYIPMRLTEIIELTWGEVDLVDGFVELPDERVKNAVGRQIPLHPDILSILEARSEKAFEAHQDVLNDVLVFGRVNKDVMYKQWVKSCAAVGLQDFHFHDLRHCAITNLRRAGNDVWTIMTAAGHKSIQSFMVYNEVTDDELMALKWEGRI